jgi:dolichyl-phosphate beta-glucosyltransferase
MTLVVAGLLYLALGFALWVHAWAEGATTHTLCGCGDPALFLWFFQWPATALSHGQNPFFSTALFHPHGINLLAQTSVTGLSLPLVPVTWIWGPVASLNVASTITPALTAFTAFVVIRRWVSWTPAAFVGGLLYGFSPFVLSSLEFGHLMTAALMLLPLILAVFDEILIRQRHSVLWTGVLLAVLLFAQFFLSSELLAIVAVVIVICVVALVAAALVAKPAEVRARFPHAAKALAIGLGLGLVLLAWPVWFALKGPASLSGLVWPNVGVIGGFIPSSFVTTGYPPRKNVFFALGGYEGAPLASAAYLGWSFLAVMVAGVIAFWRDRRLWFFAFALVVCAACSLGERHGQWEPAWVFTRIPVLENIIEQRFMAIGYLAAAIILAIILERVYRLLPQWRGVLGVVGAAAVAAVALVPMGVVFGGRLPFAMQPVTLPPWYFKVAPTLPPGRVLLSYPAPFSGLQSAMAWQAVNRMHYSQAGGGGPQGVEARAGSAQAGFKVLSLLDFGVGEGEPAGTPAQYAAVRHALSLWQVNTVVIATDPAAPRAEQGHDPIYAAAFMTAALGRRPTVQAGAWVWDNVRLGLTRPLVLSAGTLATCTGAAEKRPGVFRATMQVVNCVSGGAQHAP